MSKSICYLQKSACDNNCLAINQVFLMLKLFREILFEISKQTFSAGDLYPHSRLPT